MIVKNRTALLSRGNQVGRKIVLDILEAGLVATDSYPNMRKVVRQENGKIIFDAPEFAQLPGQKALVLDLKDIKNIYVVGGGKAVQRQAQALEDILGDLITEGHICIKKGSPVILKRIGVTLAGHPLPDKDSVAGASRIMEIMQKAGKGDIVIWLQSGGGTALLALPAPGISLKDLQEVYRVLYFGAGASMPEANAVRNRIAILNLNHEKYVHDATLVYFITNEWPPVGRAHLFENPTALNAYEKAIFVLKKYRCWDKMPSSVQVFLTRADPKYLPPTPQELTQRPYYRFRVMGPEYMLNAAKAKAEALGLSAEILATSLNDVEAKTTGEVLARIAQESEIFGQPLKLPCVYICGGEVVVAIGQEKGIGGRNQELALAAAQVIAGSQNTVIASVDSDGSDGLTDVTGAIVDGFTLERIEKSGFSLIEELRRHNSYPVFKALDDAVVTGNTGTNVRDLRVLYVGETYLKRKVEDDQSQ
jgi:glycerate 2-kinase